MMPWLIFPDTVDVAELKLGKRDTGSFSGLMTFSRKICTALAILIVGWVLSGAHYISGVNQVQPKSALIAIRVLLGASVTVLISLGFLFSMLYKITDKKLARVRYYLDVQRAGNNDTLTDGEQAEREALLNELAGASKVKKESKSTPAQGNDGADGE